jgi:NACHT domain-containing protein
MRYPSPRAILRFIAFLFLVTLAMLLAVFIVGNVTEVQGISEANTLVGTVVSALGVLVSWWGASRSSSQPIFPNNRLTVDLSNEASEQNRQNRARMLEKVEQTWIKGLLNDSLNKAVLIELGMVEKVDAVENPWGMMLKQHHSDQALPRGTKIIHVYDDTAKELLILGAPGAGKTTTLLELTRELIKRAKTNDAEPIPVVFHLSSWAAEHKSLAEWLEAELAQRYEVPQAMAKVWVEKDRLLLLLDGLDEVDANWRNDCVTAINDFRSKHGLVPVVICSRIGDYEELRVKLRLQSAVVLQPLTLEQINGYFAELGSGLNDLKLKIQQYDWMQELAQEPLILSVMILAYQATPSEARSGFLSAILTGTASKVNIQVYRKQLFETYVQRMIERRESSLYNREHMLKYLTWLAGRMAERKQAVFYIEGLQPDWLPAKVWRPRYRVGVGLVFGLAFGLVGGLAVGLARGLAVGLAFGLAVALAIGLVGGLAFGLVLEQKIELAEKLTWRFSWRTLAGGLVGALAVGLAVGLAFGLAGALASGLVGALAGGLARGLEPSEAIETRTEANQGIRRSIRSFFRLWPPFGLILGIGLAIASGVSGKPEGVIPFFALGAMFGSIFSLGFAGGEAVLKHGVLRWLLWRAGYAPLNYADFLNVCADRILLRKVGGGYIFIHRYLLEYFAGLESTAEKAE